MNLSHRLPLTETTFLILLALRTPSHGYAVMQKAEEMSEGRVRIAAGTMYGALENLVKQKLIETVSSSDARRKLYRTTSSGNDLLEQETQRMEKLLQRYRAEIEGQK